MLRVLNTRLVAATLVGAAFGAGGGFAVAAAVGRSVPSEKAAALGRLASVATTDSNTEPVPAPELGSQPIPAHVLGPGAPVPVSPSVLRPRNGWLVSDGRTLVAVYAGAAGDDPSVGRLVVVRQDLVSGSETVRTVDARATGALTVAAAPLGRGVETSAQTGSLRLQSARGPALRLDLGTDRVTGR